MSKFDYLEKKNKSIFKTYLIYFLCMLVLVFERIAISSDWLPFASDSLIASIIMPLFIQLVIMFAIPLTMYCLLLKQTPKQVFKTCNYNKINFTVFVISLILGVLAFIVNVAVSTMYSGILNFIGYEAVKVIGTNTIEYTPDIFILNVITVAVLPAIMEEFLHRGIILQGTKHSGFAKAILISAICFSLIHLNITQFLPTFVLGLILGYVAVVANNIWPAVIIHFVNNFIAEYLSFASYYKIFGSNFYSNLNSFFTQTSFVIAFMVMFLGLISVLALMWLLIKQLYKYAILKHVKSAVDLVYDSADVTTKNSPILSAYSNENKEKPLLENTSVLNLKSEEQKSPLSVVMPKQINTYKANFKDNLFLYCTIFLGLLITILSMVWGII